MRLWIAEESVCETSEGSRRKKETNPCPKGQNNGACAKHAGFRPNEIAWLDRLRELGFDLRARESIDRESS